jgi:uncharacterized protein (UPF0548 family)
MRLCFSVPSNQDVREFLRSIEGSAFSYADVGATRDLGRPAAFLNYDRNRVELGRGAETWERAKAAVRGWKMFEHSLTSIFWPDTPLAAGNVVGLLAHHLGFHSLSACKIVYVIDEPLRFGFAYGTLQQHAESGEERFLVEWDEATDAVAYDLYAFSRPRAPLARIAAPYTRILQKRFVELSKDAMVKACQPVSSSRHNL